MRPSSSKLISMCPSPALSVRMLAAALGAACNPCCRRKLVTIRRCSTSNCEITSISTVFTPGQRHRRQRLCGYIVEQYEQGAAFVRGAVVAAASLQAATGHGDHVIGDVAQLQRRLGERLYGLRLAKLPDVQGRLDESRRKIALRIGPDPQPCAGFESMRAKQLHGEFQVITEAQHAFLYVDVPRPLTDDIAKCHYLANEEAAWSAKW